MGVIKYIRYTCIPGQALALLIESNMSTEKWKTVGSKNKSHSGGKKETSAKITRTSKVVRVS